MCVTRVCPHPPPRPPLRFKEFYNCHCTVLRLRVQRLFMYAILSVNIVCTIQYTCYHTQQIPVGTSSMMIPVQYYLQSSAQHELFPLVLLYNKNGGLKIIGRFSFVLFRDVSAWCMQYMCGNAAQYTYIHIQVQYLVSGSTNEIPVVYTGARAFCTAPSQCYSIFKGNKKGKKGLGSIILMCSFLAIFLSYIPLKLEYMIFRLHTIKKKVFPRRMSTRSFDSDREMFAHASFICHCEDITCCFCLFFVWFFVS